MITKTLQPILLLITLLLLNACGGSSGGSSHDATSQVENIPTETTEGKETKSTTETTDSQSEDETTSNDDAVARAAAKIDNLVIQVHDNSFETKSKLYSALDSMLLDSTRIEESYTNRMVAEMKLLNTLAQPFAIADAYQNSFSFTKDYNGTTPAFVIEKALTNSYFLVSSENKFYLEGKTIKTYFKDASTLTTAWKRAISYADKTKDLYLALIEIDTNGKVTQVTNSLLIKSATLTSY